LSKRGTILIDTAQTIRIELADTLSLIIQSEEGELLAATDSEIPQVFLETQFQRDGNFYKRWFTSIFIFLYRQESDRLWRAVVIYPNRATEVQPPRAYALLLDLPWVHRLYLEDVADGPATTPGMQLLQLITAEPAAAVTRAQGLLEDRWGQRDDPQTQQFIDLIETILVYKLPHLSREEIQAMLHLPDVDLKQTRFYQDVFAEGRTEGHTEGQEEGWQREVALVLRQLLRRCGALDPEQEARIQALSVTELEALGETLLDFQTVADLTAWLQQQS
jgi:predicted transposase/invertase (TIGR01784 family)